MSYPIHALGFNDVSVDQEWVSAERTVTEAEIMAFAQFSGDFNPIHMDAEFAATTPYRQRIAHGLGVMCLASGLGLAAPPMRTMALLAIREWQYLKPVFIGDTISVRTKVLAVTPQGKGRRGEVTWQRTVVNQSGETVQQGTVVTLVERRSPAGI